VPSKEKSDGRQQNGGEEEEKSAGKTQCGHEFRYVSFNIAGSLQPPCYLALSLHTLDAHVEDGMLILAKMQYAVTGPVGLAAVM
jgi:hypothetical protein